MSEDAHLSDGGGWCTRHVECPTCQAVYDRDLTTVCPYCADKPPEPQMDVEWLETLYSISCPRPYGEIYGK